MWFNPIFRWLLRSPLHSITSNNTMLITYTGLKSSKVYTTPVNYVRAGDDFITTSFRNRIWWRNLRGGAPVTLRVKGKDLEAVGEVFEDDDGVAAGMMEYLQIVPSQAKYFNVGLDAEGSPNAADVATAAKGRVIIRCHLL